MTEEEIAALKTELEAIKAENATLKAKPVETPPPKVTAKEDDLVTKAREEITKQDKDQADVKVLEKALKFNLEVESFVKSNKTLLPTEVEKIVEMANKETYDTALDKSKAVKVGLITSFFSQQVNVDAMTASQKASYEEFTRLSQKAKAEKAEYMFDHVFEPVLELQKKVKKAEELGKARSGIVTATDAEGAYKQKMINFSKKAYLKETIV